MSRRFLLLLAFAMAGCGEPQQTRPASVSTGESSARHSAGANWIERGNWVVEWSEYTSKEVTLDGKRLVTFTPAAGARQHVRDADAPSKVDGGAKATARIVMAAAVLEPGTMSIDVGAVAERNVLQDKLEALAVAGDSARVYWTWRRRAVRSENGQSIEVPFSTILIEGVHPGKTELFLHWPESVKETLVVMVGAGASTP